jgi:hypothetical protein
MTILTPSDAVIAAAYFLQNEWRIHGMSLATTSTSFSVDSGNTNYVWYVFEAGHTDGSRWLIAATRYGHTCHTDRDDMTDLKRAAQERADENERKLMERRD